MTTPTQLKTERTTSGDLRASGERITYVYLRSGNSLINSNRPSIRVGQDLEINGPGNFRVQAAFREAGGVRLVLADGAEAFIPNECILLTLATAERMPKPAA